MLGRIRTFGHLAPERVSTQRRATILPALLLDAQLLGEEIAFLLTGRERRTQRLHPRWRPGRRSRRRRSRLLGRRGCLGRRRLGRRLRRWSCWLRDRLRAMRPGGGGSHRREDLRLSLALELDRRLGLLWFGLRRGRDGRCRLCGHSRRGRAGRGRRRNGQWLGCGLGCGSHRRGGHRRRIVRRQRRAGCTGHPVLGGPPKPATAYEQQGDHPGGDAADQKRIAALDRLRAGL